MSLATMLLDFTLIGPNDVLDRFLMDFIGEKDLFMTNETIRFSLLGDTWSKDFIGKKDSFMAHETIHFSLTGDTWF